MDIISPDAGWSGGLLTGPMIELKLLDTAVGEGVIEGYAASFGGVDFGGDTIVPGAFKDTIAHHHAAGTAPAMLWAHRQSEPIGKWIAMGEDARGLRVQGRLNTETEPGRKAHAHIKAGDVTGLSIGYDVAQGGAKQTATGRTLTKLHLHETSVVTVPMDPRARITGVKSLGSRADLEDLLRETGLARGAAKKIAAGGWPALSGEADPNPEDPSMRALLMALDGHHLDLKGLNR